MTKKEYIIRLLTALQKDRSIAGDLKLLIQDNALQDAEVDALMQIFVNAMKSITDENKLQKMQRGMQVLEKIKEREEREIKEEKNDLEAILNGLE